MADLFFQMLAFLASIFHLKEFVQIRHREFVELSRCPVKALDERPAHQLEGCRVTARNVPENTLAEIYSAKGLTALA